MTATASPSYRPNATAAADSYSHSADVGDRRSQIATTFGLALLPPSAQLLAVAAGGRRTRHLLPQVLANPLLDWQEVIRLATREKACSQIYACVREEVGDDIDRLAPTFAGRAAISTFQLAFLHDQFERTLARLSEQRVDVLVLKGAALAYSTYRHPLDRPMGDVDILVRPESVAAVCSAAEQSGWVCRRDVSTEQRYRGHHHLPPFEDTRGVGVGLEVHTQLFPPAAPFLMDASLLWEEARTAKVGPHVVRVPSVNHALLHACVHFFWSHEGDFGGWRTLRDISLLLEDERIDWSSVIMQARRSKGSTCCYWSLRLARDLCGCSVPASVMQLLQPSLPSSLLHALACHFTQQLFAIDKRCPSVTLSRALWWLGVLPPQQRHGRSLPWRDEGLWQRPDSKRITEASSARVARGLKRGFKSTAYLGRLLRPTATLGNR